MGRILQSVEASPGAVGEWELLTPPGLGLGQSYILAANLHLPVTLVRKTEPGQGPSHANVQSWQVGAGFSLGTVPEGEGKQQKSLKEKKREKKEKGKF